MSTHHKGHFKEARALDCYIKLIRAADSMSRLSLVLCVANWEEP